MQPALLQTVAQQVGGAQRKPPAPEAAPERRGVNRPVRLRGDQQQALLPFIVHQVVLAAYTLDSEAEATGFPHRGNRRMMCFLVGNRVLIKKTVCPPSAFPRYRTWLRNSRVRGSRGASKKSFGDPDSTISPLSVKNT